MFSLQSPLDGDVSLSKVSLQDELMVGVHSSGTKETV